jgi:hypothetical protein
MAEQFVKIVYRNLEQVVKEALGYADRAKKASGDALKVEGYRLMRELKEDLRQGKAGGSVFSPLTEIAKRMRKPINRKPLSKLATAIRYSAGLMGGNPTVSVGFLDAGTKKISKSWMRIAQKAQEGGETPYTYEKRMALYAMGQRLKKRGDPAAKFFFLLRKSRDVFKTPPRPIIEPFWNAHWSETERNVLINFERKMRGERI